MKEKDLKDLEFEKMPTDDGKYYYILDIGSFCLMTQECNDEIKNKSGWTVTIWDNCDIVFKKREPLEELINIIKAHKKKLK